TFDTALNPSLQIAGRSLFTNISGYDAPDSTTFRVNLKQADCPFLVSTMLTPLLPKHLLGNSADMGTDPFRASPAAATGPFMFKEWVGEEYLALAANPHHWRGRPAIDTWMLRSVANQNGLPDKLKLGEIDYAKVAATAVDELKGQPNLNLLSVSSPTQFFLIAYNL